MKKLWNLFDVLLIVLVAAPVCIVLTFFENRVLAYAEAGVLLALIVAKLVFHHVKKARLFARVHDMTEALNLETGGVFSALSIPLAVTADAGAILYFNDAFRAAFGLSEKTRPHNLCDLIGVKTLEPLLVDTPVPVFAAEQYFSVYFAPLPEKETADCLFCFIDETALRLTQRDYENSRPAVLLTSVDNAEELYQTFKESECTAVFSQFAQMVEDWATGYGALCRKLSATRMIVIAEEHMLRRMIEEKFPILDQVRSFTYEGRQTEMTLSIGVGREDDFIESNNSAKQALGMAQSRGGDQVAIRRETQYQFFGGVSSGLEQRSKAKTRLIASAIAEVIRDSENVLIMGHRYSEYDAIGAAVGVFAIRSSLNKDANIVVDAKTTLSLPLCKRYAAAAGRGIFISPEHALMRANENTLLVVVDTHKADFTECPALFDLCGKVIVIDHHRKSVGFIDNAVVFYHLPTASSASEMVTELCQYTGKTPILDAMAAQALFAGMLLDTRNFVLRTGVRTFEAAAYLRSRGANTVEAKQLFAIDMDIFHRRNRIIDAAERYRDVCAISVSTDEGAQQRLITSQAADEMLNISNVKASFVVFLTKGSVNISARSFGDVNVQLVMESLGGGGHQTMAACQLGEIPLAEAVERLKAAIDATVFQ